MSFLNFWVRLGGTLIKTEFFLAVVSMTKPINCFEQSGRKSDFLKFTNQPRFFRVFNTILALSSMLFLLSPIKKSSTYEMMRRLCVCRKYCVTGLINLWQK